MSRRYFTVGEVDRLVPRLEQIFVHVLQLRAGMRAQQEKLERAGVMLTPEVLESRRDVGGSAAAVSSREVWNPPRVPGEKSRREAVEGDPPEVRQSKLLFSAFYEELTQRLGEVRRLGGEVKDLEIGLVDFLARRRDEDILLCWKLGERNVEHWHEVDAGFGGRRPIDAEVPREPPARH
jgi:hypothetical protein